MAEEFRIEDFNINKNLVLQASAGTGKTYNICEIVDKLLDAGVSIEQMLIVTYTEKAAGELKNRIREKTRGRDVDVDSASICTIHSFCQQTLEEFSLSANKSSKLQLIDNSEANDFAKRYVRSGEIYEEICGIKRRMPNSEMEKDIVKKISAFLSKYYLNSLFAKDESIVILKKDISGIENLDQYHDFAKKYYVEKKSTFDLFEGLEADVEILHNSKRQKMRELAEILQSGNNLNFSRTIYKVSKEMTDNEQEAFNRIKERQDLFRMVADLDNLKKAIVIIHASDIFQKWTEEKEKNRTQTFDDMIRSVREEVVNEGPLLDRLKEKYRYAIIDEFQDTNQKQWDIFKKVFMCEGHNIIVVGDPKQSIYSFQGADLNVFRKAIGEILDSGGEERQLVKNYRATGDVIKATNDFFSIEGAIDSFSESQCGNDKFKVTYEKSTPQPFWVCEEKGPEKYADVVCQTIADCCTLDENNHSKLRFTYVDDDGKTQERNATFADFVILAKSRPEMKPFEKALEKSGIPYVKYKDTGLFTGRECAHWIALLDAVNTPDFTGRNRVKFRRALFTLFFDKSLEEIKDSKYDKDNTDEVLLFEKWRSLAGERRWEELIEAILEDTKIEKRLGSLKDMNVLGILRQIGDYAINYLSNSGNLTLLVKSLQARLKDNKDEDAEEGDSIISKHSDFDAVRIMTIHASKGLEFPVVISVAGHKGFKTSEDIYGFHNAAHKYVLSFEKDPERCNQEQREEFQRLIYVAYTRAKYVLILPGGYSKNKNMEFVMNTIESFCQDRSAYRPLTDNGNHYDALKHQVAFILTKNRELSNLAGEGTSISGENSSLTIDAQREVLKTLIKTTPKLSAYKHAYSSMSHPHAAEETMSDTKINVSNEDGSENQADTGLAKYDTKAKQIMCRYEPSLPAPAQCDGYPAGPDIGNALHDVLEAIDYTGTVRTPEMEELIKKCFKAYGIRKNAQWIADTEDMLENVLSACLPEIKGSTLTGEEFRLKDISFTDRKNEAEFNFNKEGEKLKNYFNGFVDLIMRRGEYYSVLDWKSDRLKDEFSTYCDAEVVKARVDERYPIQRVLYSYMLIKWLKKFYPEASEQEIFEKHFGGIYYVFLRSCRSETGNGIYAQTWENYAVLKEAFDEIVKDKV